jgi:hypothetical protein
MVSPGTPITLRTPFGVAPVMNNLKLKRSRKLAKLLHIIRYKQKRKEKE